MSKILIPIAYICSLWMMVNIMQFILGFVFTNTVFGCYDESKVLKVVLPGYTLGCYLGAK